MQLLSIGLLCFVLPQDPGAAGPPRRGNWQAPSRGDWEAPPRIDWQRSVADAEAIARAQRRPLLFVVNMDGEPASEQFAAQKYRDPSFAALAAPFVKVVASIQRHSPRDHDERGRRIPCPRFGSVTCGEHIAAEAELFARWFQDNPVAPRHLAVDPDGDKLFDRFLDQDLRAVDRALEEHGAKITLPERAAQPALEALVASREVEDRDELERRFVEAAPEQRRAILQLARGVEPAPVELIRLALHDADPALREAALDTLASANGPGLLPLLQQALGSADFGAAGDAARARLLGALDALAARDPAARSPARLLRGILRRSKLLAQLRPPRLDAPATPREPPDLERIEARLDELTAQRRQRPDDGSLRADLAEAVLAFARARQAGGHDANDAYAEALANARAALAQRGPAARCQLVIAFAAWQLGEGEVAADAVAAALPQLELQPDAGETAELLAILAHGRRAAIARAAAAAQDWPEEHASDAADAFRLLRTHRDAEPSAGVAEVAFLDDAGLGAPAVAALEHWLGRFPYQPELHEWLRNVLLHRRGADALLDWYASRSAAASDPASHGWFAGYAALVVAESHAQARRDDAARAAYAASIERFAPALQVEANRDSVTHFQCFAHAGLARLALESGATADAAGQLLTALRLRPASAFDADGRGRAPVQTATAIRFALRRAGDDVALEQFEQELRRIDARLLQSRR